MNWVSRSPNSLVAQTAPFTESRRRPSGRADAAAGRRIFLEKTEAACTRCHKVGGEVGPALPTPEMLKQKDRRRYALESIVVPNKDVAKGFDQVVLQRKDETTETGRIERESGTEVVLILPDGKRRTIAATDIAGQQIEEEIVMNSRR